MWIQQEFSLTGKTLNKDSTVNKKHVFVAANTLIWPARTGVLQVKLCIQPAQTGLWAAYGRPATNKNQNQLITFCICSRPTNGNVSPNDEDVDPRKWLEPFRKLLHQVPGIHNPSRAN